MPKFYMILARKNSKIPKFYYICPKINRIPEFYFIFAPKMPEFYVIILSEKYFSRFCLGGGHHRESKKHATKLLFISSPNVDRF